MAKKISLLVTLIYLFFTPLFSQDITMSWLKSKPKSYAKDFYIWRYLNQNITPKEANEALGQVRYLNNKIFYRYINKADDEILKDYKSCLKAKNKILVKKEAYCIEAGLSIYDATKLSKKELRKVIKKVEKPYPKFAEKLKVINSASPFKSLQTTKIETFFAVFNNSGVKFRKKYLNKTFSVKLLNKLKKDKKKFAILVKTIVTNKYLDKPQKSLLNLKANELDFKTTFHLAINAIRLQKEKKALDYLNLAYKKAYFQMEKDNITFWQYQLTKEKKYLDILVSSWDVNIYTLFANNKLKTKQKNIVYKIKQNKNSKTTYDITDPFSWLKVLKDTKKMDNEKLKKYENIFTTNETLGHLAFVNERYNKYKKSYFITPYEKNLTKLDKNRQALIYAIARQESRFIPTSISTAYAMGTMQIMPFLSKALAKQLKEPYDIDMQLNAKTNLKYANHHLNFLTKRLNNPLFVAYAYNGGIGFTKRSLKTGLFKNKKYEPWLSMELIRYNETKKYGKKVLANYFVYQNYLNKKNKQSFDTLIKNILVK